MDIGARCLSVWSCHEVIKDLADSEKFDRNVNFVLKQSFLLPPLPSFVCVVVYMCIARERERERERDVFKVKLVAQKDVRLCNEWLLVVRVLAQVFPLFAVHVFFPPSPRPPSAKGYFKDMSTHAEDHCFLHVQVALPLTLKATH